MIKMITTGDSLRKHREDLNLSQAKLARATGISQYIISAFELEKINVSADTISAIEDVICDSNKVEELINKKKKYQKHNYSRIQDTSRKNLCNKSNSNTEFVAKLNEMQNFDSPQFNALSIFSGCGGLSYGFASGGFAIKGFVEINDNLSKIYSENFPNTPRLGSDISKVTDQQISTFAKNNKIDVVIGGPPCQGFSLAGKRNSYDPRNQLFIHYMRMISGIKPKIAVMENVCALTSMKLPDGSFVKDQIIKEFKDLGYNAQIFSINAADYGVPQDRKRVLFIATRNDLGVSPSIPSKTHFDESYKNKLQYKTFADACSDLDFIESGAKSKDSLHFAVSHPDHVIKWLWDVPEGFSAHDNLNPNLRPPSGYNTTYKRQVWSKPASTVQTTFAMISGSRNVHPIATRSLTIREASRLQTFPDGFKFEGSLGSIRTGIGNAVPPKLAKCVAKHIKSILLN